MSLLVNTTNNLQLKMKGEGKQYTIGATLAPGWCSELGLLVLGQQRKTIGHNSSWRRDVSFE